jgi:hypothetical protein
MLRLLKKLLADAWKPRGHVCRRMVRLQVECLEERAVPAGTWTTLAHPVPMSDGAQTMMLLSDGTVMVHGGSGIASTAWYRLTPNSTGSYVGGTWSKLSPMNTARLYFTSDILPDSRAFVLGGEYSDPNTDLNYVNTGEIYDPVANTWTTIANFPQGFFGDDPSEVLPNGQVLSGYLFGPQTYLYDPATDSWSATGTKLRGDRSDEESWVKLPDDSILSYDIWSSILDGTGHAQRYIPSQGQWVDAGTVPVLLSAEQNADELGPALLLPDGRVFFLGSTGNTAFYTPPTDPSDPGSWTAGPPIPNGLTAYDDPAAMLPNGDVLFAAAPRVAPIPNTNPQQYAYTGPTTIFEFNPTTNTYTNVTPGNFNLNQPSYQNTMLVLPTGQVLLTNDSRQIDVFTPFGAPDPSWRPTISNITDNGNNTFTLTGTQLNGISEGANFGDDNEMASNYPIIRLTDANGNVSFAQSFNWSSTGVATGSTPESVQFTLPAADAPGPYLVSVIANGIASAPVLDVQMGAVNTDLALQADPNNSGNLQVLNAGSLLGEFPVSSFQAIIVTGSNNDNTIAIENTFSGVPVTLNEGTGQDSISVGDGSLDSIQGPLTINGGEAANAGATDSLFINDQGFAGSRTFTITDTTIAWGGPTIAYSGLGSLTINGGTGGNTFDVLATSASAALAIVGGGNGDSLTGSNSGNTFAITGNNAGTLSGAAYASNVFFTQVGNLTAGSGGNTFRFADGASLTGNITGGGRDTLDYSASRSSVLVDLQTGFASGVGGSVSGIATVDGGSASPASNGVYNLLIGAGGDTLTGGLGRRNILVAGASASTLNAGDGEDLLIGGSTTYDQEAGLSSWQLIAAYWAGSDDYATRLANLTSGSGVPLVDASVVTGNGGGNTLTGNGALALFYTDGLDNITGFDPNSQQVPIAP